MSVNETEAVYIPIAAKIANLGVELAVCGLFYFAWYKFHSLYLLVASIGCAVRAPVAYRVPVIYTKPLKPLGRVSFYRRFKPIERMLVLIGNVVLLVALFLWLHQVVGS